MSETFAVPKIRSRLRNRPPRRVRRARGQLNGVVAVVGLAIGFVLLALVFLRQAGARDARSCT